MVVPPPPDRSSAVVSSSDRIARALDAVRAGRPRMLVIEGEPGIGKTAFLRRCLAEAEDFVVLEAIGDEAETTLDLGVVAELIARAPAGPQAPATTR